MSTASVLSHPRRPRSASSAKWVKDTRDLMSEVKQWASQMGWSMKIKDVTLTEPEVGTYSIPVLTIEASEGRLTVEPIASRTPEFNGRIDLYGYPSLARMILLRDTESIKPQWRVRTDDDVEWPLDWGQETFYQIANGLIRVL